MIGITLCTTILFTWFSYARFKNIYNPYTSFNIVWSMVITLIFIGNEFVYTPSDEALLCIILGIIGYNISAYIKRIVYNDFSIFKFPNEIKSYYIPYDKIYCLSYIVLIYMSWNSMDVLTFINSGMEYSEIRNMYFTVDNASSVIKYYVSNYFIGPMRYVILLTSIIAFYKRSIYSTKLVCMSAMLLLLQAFVSGGRYVLMNAAFMIICGYCLFGGSKNLTKAQMFSISCFIVFLFCGISFLTDARTTFLMTDMDLFDKIYFTFYTYFAGSITYLGVVADSYPFVIGATKGVNFIAGFISPVFAALTFLGILPYPEILNVIGKYACEVLPIGTSTYYNAMPSIFGYYYIDGGLVFVFVEALLFGYLCNICYKNAVNGDLLYIAFYIMLFMQICVSTTRWFFYSSEFCLAFVYLYFFYKKNWQIRF